MCAPVLSSVGEERVEIPDIECVSSLEQAISSRVLDLEESSRNVGDALEHLKELEDQFCVSCSSCLYVSGEK